MPRVSPESLLWPAYALVVLAALGPRILPSLPLLSLGASLLLLLLPLRLRPEEQAWWLALFGLYLLYLLPLPWDLVSTLSTQTPRVELTAILQADPQAAPLSLDPHSSSQRALALILPAALYLLGRQLDHQHWHTLASALIWLAIALAVLALIQIAAALAGANLGSVLATYTNRNHFVGLILLLWPLSWALALTHLRDQSPRALWWLAAAVLLLFVLLASRSRAGLLLGLGGLVLAMGFLIHELPHLRRLWLLVLPLLGILALAVLPWSWLADRWTLTETVQEVRPTLWQLGWSLLLTYWPLGSGPGTLEAVFAPLQPLSLGPWRVNHLHQAWLEWMVEGGLGAALLLLTALWTLSHQVILWRHSTDPRRPLVLAAACGLTLMGIQECFDFALTQPANSAVAALLGGLCLQRPNLRPC